MENALLVLTVLISLSYISERISNLLKLYLPDSWISSLKPDSKKEEKKRERKILLLTLLSGILTSILFFSSFCITEIEELLFPLKFQDWWHFPIMVLLVGILLSFGSKFWHDILDIVMSVKNAKQLLVDEKTEEINVKVTEQGLQKFKKLSHEEQRKVIHQFIEKKSAEIKSSFPEIQDISVFKKVIFGKEQSYYCLRLDIIEKQTDVDETRKIPATISFTANDNVKYNIPTDIFGVGTNSFSGFIGEGEMPKTLGLSCSRKSHGSNNYPTGTIGLKVYKEGVPYLLSCYHVLCYPEMIRGEYEFNSSASSDKQVVSPSEKDGYGVTMGQVIEGWLNTYLDVALAKLDNDTNLKNTYYDDYGAPKGRVEINDDNKHKNINLRLFGRTSGYREGTLEEYFVNESYFDIKQNSGVKKLKMTGLLKINKISSGGDSGATIINDAGQLVGLLVGGNEKYSYAIPITTIFNRLNLDN